MHERDVTQNLIDQVLKATDKPIKQITAELGSLTTYKAEPIEFYFDNLKKEAEQLKNSTLKLIEIKGSIYCNSCKKESHVDDPTLMACNCGSIDIKIKNGKDFMIKQIEVFE